MEAWLAPTCFTPLRLPAVPDVGLMLPYSEYSPSSFIIGYLEDELWAIFYSEMYRYEAVRCADADRWHGLYIPKVQFEIDLTSAFDTQSKSTPRGSLIRDADKLYIAGSIPERGYTARTHLFRLVEGLEVSAVHEKVGFSKWRVKVGDDDKRTVFMEFDLLTEAAKDTQAS